MYCFTRSIQLLSYQSTLPQDTLLNTCQETLQDEQEVEVVTTQPICKSLFHFISRISPVFHVFHVYHVYHVTRLSCHPSIMSPVYHVTHLSCHPSIMSPIYHVTRLSCHPSIMSPIYHGTRLSCHPSIMSPVYHVTRLSCHLSIMSPVYHVTCLSCHPSIMSPACLMTSFSSVIFYKGNIYNCLLRQATQGKTLLTQCFFSRPTDWGRKVSLFSLEAQR